MNAYKGKSGPTVNACSGSKGNKSTTDPVKEPGVLQVSVLSHINVKAYV